MNIPCHLRPFRPGRLGILLTLLAGSAATLSAQTNGLIEQLSIEATQIRVLLRHAAGTSPGFILQSTTNFTGWSATAGATNSVVDSTHIEWRFPRPANPYLFFRALANISPDDPDGDGLPTIAEAGLGTNPNLADSDGDGFTDGAEVLAGTNPLDINSFPRQSGVPVAAFANAISVAPEDGGVQTLTVDFDRPATGNLHFRVNPQSTAVAGRDYQPFTQLTVPIAGATARISIRPVDDLVPRPDRTLTLELVEMTGYRNGVISLHSVRFTDDDAFWNGVLKDRYAERNFRLLLSRSNNVTQACFVAGEGQDGLPILNTNAPGSSISEGVVPAGCHAATVTTDTATLFSITSPELAAGSSGIFAGNVSLARTFSLDATAANTNHHIDAILIVGNYTERIGITNTAASYLDQTNSGAFMLVRELPGQTTVTNGLSLPPSP